MDQLSTSAPEWCAWAGAERHAGRTKRAVAGFRRALALDSGSLAARFGLASMLLDAGDLAGADEVAAHMALSDPDRPDVLWLRGRLSVAKDAPEAAHDTLLRLLASSTINSAQRAEALLLLGVVLDNLGRYDQAFVSAREGKRIQRELHAQQAATREGETAKLQRLTAWMAGTPPCWSRRPATSAKGAASTHVFLLGFPRSGTTLLEQVLAAHPGVATLEEAPTLAAAYEAFLSDEEACTALMQLSDEEAVAWAEHYWADVARRGVQAPGRVFVDKQPAGTLSLPIIARLFPDAKILFAIRDPRDVVLSCFRQAFQMNAMTFAFTDLREAARCYDACMALSERARECLPLTWTDVRHEALVETFDAELARITGFLGLEPDPAMADFALAAQTRTIRTPSAPQVRVGLNRRGLSRWERYRESLSPVMPALTPWVERFGYVP